MFMRDIIECFFVVRLTLPIRVTFGNGEIVDDVIMYSDTTETLFEYFEAVLEILEFQCVTIKIRKRSGLNQNSSSSAETFRQQALHFSIQSWLSDACSTVLHNYVRVLLKNTVFLRCP
jgi:hypothetical protein